MIDTIKPGLPHAVKLPWSELEVHQALGLPCRIEGYYHLSDITPDNTTIYDALARRVASIEELIGMGRRSEYFVPRLNDPLSTRRDLIGIDINYRGYNLQILSALADHRSNGSENWSVETFICKEPNDIVSEYLEYVMDVLADYDSYARLNNRTIASIISPSNDTYLYAVRLFDGDNRYISVVNSVGGPHFETNVANLPNNLNNSEGVLITARDVVVSFFNEVQNLYGRIISLSDQMALTMASQNRPKAKIPTF